MFKFDGDSSCYTFVRNCQGVTWCGIEERDAPSEGKGDEPNPDRLIEVRPTKDGECPRVVHKSVALRPICVYESIFQVS